MGLADFIDESGEVILAEFESFARTLLPASVNRDKEALRAYGAQILAAIAADMRSPQTANEQSEKSKGHAPRAPREPDSPQRPAETHGERRTSSGFNVSQTASEYRALRASVIRLWLETSPPLGPGEVDELIRFNEAMDQALAESLQHFAQEAARARNLFLGVLSHELRTPLGTIVASAHSLLQAAEQQRTLPDATNRILRGGKRIESLLNDLLDYVRSGVGDGMRVTPTKLGMDELCEKVARDLEVTFPGSRVEMQTEGDMAGRWDEQRVYQAVSNLVSNAIRYGSAGASVRVQIGGAAEDEVVVAVHNAGPAIPDETRESLFQPLVRGGGPDKTGSSLGLGLYIVREIALAHGGTVAVTSSAQAGTVFSIRLPRSSDATHPPAFESFVGMN